MIRTAILAGALVCAPAAFARTADYSRSEAQFADDAKELDVAAMAAMPERGEVDLLVENAQSLDHRLKILGIHCSAWKVENPLSQMVARALGMWDRDGTLGPAERRPLVRLRFTSASSNMRCVEVEELEGRCLTRTSINGEAVIEKEGQAARTAPIAIEVEEQQAVGACAVARGAGLSGRAASIALVDRLKALAAAD
jgi:uncharacterized lipoprotein YmbA